MKHHVKTITRHTGLAAEKTIRVAVDVIKPAVRATVSMVSRHPEAVVGALAGYAVGRQRDRVWGLRHLTGGKARYILAFAGGLYGYQMALQRRGLDIREDEGLHGRYSCPAGGPPC